MKNRIPKHVGDAANALLNQHGLNLKNLTRQELDQLPEAVKTAVSNLLQPYGWQVRQDDQESNVKYLSVAAAEKYASVSRWTLTRAAAKNELQLIKLGTSKSSKVLVDKAEIDKWLRARRCH